jgi:hypothetical protein
MDDIPQGGSGGVPDPHTEDRQRPDEQDLRVKTVRAGEPVAEQGTQEKADRERLAEDQPEP